MSRFIRTSTNMLVIGGKLLKTALDCAINLTGEVVTGGSWNSFTITADISYTVYYNGTISHPLPIGSYLSSTSNGVTPFNGNPSYTYYVSGWEVAYEINSSGIITSIYTGPF